MNYRAETIEASFSLARLLGETRSAADCQIA
jgi:hypothetical protein